MDLALVFQEELLWDADEYADKDWSVSFAILDHSIWLHVVGGIFTKWWTHAMVYHGLGYEWILIEWSKRKTSHSGLQDDTLGLAWKK